jgi:DNA repair exonuclease SbcCD ATPase subunit
MAEVLEDKIQSLLARRTELVDRLDNLEALKADTNARVYKKIRGDYEDQLSIVLNGIAEQRGTLETKVGELNSQIEEKETLHTDLSDAVDELQLRARLKEFDENDTDFQGELDESMASRNQTADDLDKLRSELGDLDKVLRDVDAASEGRPASTGTTDEEVDTVGDEVEEFDEIDLEEEVESVEEEGGEKGEGVSCPSCNHQNPPQKLFCEECGAALDDDSDLDEEFDLIDDDLDL